MIAEKDMIQRLNLLRSSKTFVFREIGNQGEAEVLQLDVVPSASGIYWIYGESVLKNGRCLESVFRVDTDSGGSVLSVYWWVDGKWFDQQDSDTLSTLSENREDVFPYNWSYQVELEKDIYHD